MSNKFGEGHVVVQVGDGQALFISVEGKAFQNSLWWIMSWVFETLIQSFQDVLESVMELYFGLNNKRNGDPEWWPLEVDRLWGKGSSFRSAVLVFDFLQETGIAEALALVRLLITWTKLWNLVIQKVKTWRHHCLVDFCHQVWVFTDFELANV